MPLPSARRIQRLSHRAIVTLVATSLLSMPVTYRGGAEAAHPHTIFQLWEDVRTGSYTHHGAAARAHHHHAAHAAGEVDDAAHGGGRADSTGRDRAGDGHASADVALMAPARPVDRADVAAREPARGFPTGTEATPAAGVDEDAPKVGSAFTPEVRGSVLVLTAMGTATAGGSSSPVAEPSARLVGLVLSPVSPPPRTAA